MPRPVDPRSRGPLDRLVNPTRALAIGRLRVDPVGWLVFAVLTALAALNGLLALAVWLGIAAVFVAWPLYELRRATTGYSWMYRDVGILKASQIVAEHVDYGLTTTEAEVVRYLIGLPSNLANDLSLRYLSGPGQLPQIAGSDERLAAAEALVARGLLKKSHGCVYELKPKALARLADTRRL